MAAFHTWQILNFKTIRASLENMCSRIVVMTYVHFAVFLVLFWSFPEINRTPLSLTCLFLMIIAIVGRTWLWRNSSAVLKTEKDIGKWRLFFAVPSCSMALGWGLSLSQVPAVFGLGTQACMSITMLLILMSGAVNAFSFDLVLNFVYNLCAILPTIVVVAFLPHERGIGPLLAALIAILAFFLLLCRSLNRNEVQRLRQSEVVEEQKAELLTASETIRESHESLQLLIDNIQQGVFSVDQTGNVIDPVSKHCGTIFSRSVSGKSLIEVLYEDARADGEKFSFLKTALATVFGEGELQWIMMEQYFPRTALLRIASAPSAGDKQLRIQVSPIWDDRGLLSRILFVVEDQTAISLLKEKIKVQDRMAAIAEDLISTEIADAIPLLNALKVNIAGYVEPAMLAAPESANRALRDLHTFKGNARLLNLKVLSAKIHQCEEVAINLGRLSKSVEAQFAQAFNELKSVIELYLELIEKLSFKNDSVNKVIFREAWEQFVHQSRRFRAALIDKQRPPFDELLGVIAEVPFRVFAEKFRNMVADLGRQLGKDINYRFEGTLLLRPHYVGPLQASIVHMIRNSCDHGLETPEDRARFGKTHQGTIQIISAQVDDKVVFEVRDDGRGMSEEAVSKIALAENLVTTEDLNKMNKDEKLRLIFLDGFTSKLESNAISGRGVGMAAVLDSIETIGGDVRIQTSEGKGTSFFITVPAGEA